MSKRKLIIAVIVAGIGIGWYAFRPERIIVNRTVNEGFPAAAMMAATSSRADATVLAEGNFHDGAHKTSGKATIYQLADGKRVLRLTGFQTSNGPDVLVYLVAAPDATDAATVKRAGFITLGALKGNIGDQNYELPAGVDLNKYKAATIWCRRFSVNFGTAPLSAS